MTEPPLRALELLRTLREHNVEFIVIGGFSLAAHGYVRGTKDVDIVPAPQSGNLKRLWAALVELDAEPVEVADFRAEELPVEFGPDALSLGGNWALRTRFGRLDVMQAVAGVKDFASVSQRAITVHLRGVGEVLFAGRDDLIAMKQAADRPIDRIDIARLAQGEAG
jgi:hypothetical protein